MRKFVRQGGPALRRALGKRAYTGDVTADDECLDGLGALEGVDRLNVEHVPDNVVLKTWLSFNLRRFRTISNMAGASCRRTQTRNGFQN